MAGKPKPPIICSSCGHLLKHYAHGMCKACWGKAYRPARRIEHAASERKRRLSKRDSYLESERKRQATPERQKWKHEYYLAHKEHNAALQRQYRLRHRDKANARWAQWYADNPDKVKAKSMKADQMRRHRMLATPCTLTRDQWLAIKAAYGNRCAYCGEKRVKLTQDHVIPLSKGGGYTPDNIVPACRHCNSRKGNRQPVILPAVRLLV